MTACSEPSALIEGEPEVAGENNTYHEVFRPSHEQAKEGKKQMASPLEIFNEWQSRQMARDFEHLGEVVATVAEASPFFSHKEMYAHDCLHYHAGLDLVYVRHDNVFLSVWTTLALL